MELEFHQLDLRYAQLRPSNSKRDRRILASLDDHGQQLPVVVVASRDTGRYILVDGYKRPTQNNLVIHARFILAGVVARRSNTSCILPSRA